MATTTTPKGSIFVNNTPTNEEWAKLLLKNIGAPVTPNNVNNILLWQTLENPASNWFNRNNPLNASLGTNSTDGTGAYSDLTTAAKNTAAMIVQGYKGGAIGGGIYTALMNDAPTDQFSVQVVNSAWSSNHYGVASAGAIKAKPGRIATFLAGSDFHVPAVIGTTAATPGSGVSEAATVGATAAANAGVQGCESKKPVILLNTWGSSITGAKLQITACQIKAIGGGLSIFFGGGLMLGGLFMLSSAFAKTAVGKQVGQVVSAVPMAAQATSYEARNTRQVNRQNRKTSRSRAKNEYESNRRVIKGE